MNVREAILKAANQIEREPSCWSYMKDMVPECGTPGCALGWIGHFAGVRGHIDNVAVLLGVERVEGTIQWGFYNRIQSLTGGRPLPQTHTTADDYFLTHATLPQIAEVLRLYADKYHPAPKVEHVGIPDSVRAIFEPTNVAA
jgi:hypothetical protein